uniref:Tripartite motif containing 25, like n=1 Tax=Hippocampus comes TaxID=109280 RepID=A0A3Q2ZBX6_HIPCM
ASWDRLTEQFNCPVCLDLPNDPVTIPCGHSYCMACIKDYWSKDDPNGVYSCPQCRQTFCPRPSLSRNTMLAEAVDQLRRGIPRSVVSRSIKLKTQKRLPSSAVQCDLCQGEQKAAVKTCLVCMSSYCENHLKPHQTTKALKEHELIVPTANLADKICTQHKYLQEFFCRQCKVFICWLCTSNQHKGHESVSTKAERWSSTFWETRWTFMSAEKPRSSITKRMIDFLSLSLVDSVNFTFDPNSAHRRLLLSEGNTKATLQGEMVPYADTPQRFDGWTQVMCGTPLHSQRSYWEVEWRGRGSSVGVAYGSLSRKGSDARAGLGYNAQSWTLELSDSCCCALHDNQKRDIPVTYSPRLGVFVDLNTGTLSFYGVAESLTPLHTFRANFTQPLYAVFGVGSGLGVGLDFLESNILE